MQSLRTLFLCTVTAGSLGFFAENGALAEAPGASHVRNASMLAASAEVMPPAQGTARGAVARAENDGAWIGVRMTPIPAPLSAHLGKDGLMVGNIAVDSPADKAGLQQYDIITQFNGRQINEMQNLLDAVADADAGKDAELEVTRGAEKKTMRIRPSERPAGDAKFKYVEPDADVQSMQMSGKRLRRTPSGDWMMEDLGPLMQLPDMFQGFGHGKFGQGFGHGFGQGGLGHGPLMAPLPPNSPLPPGARPGLGGGAFQFFMDDFDDKQDTGNMQFSMTQDDVVLKVQRDDKGAYTVENVDQDSNKRTATYESLEEFRKEDPDSFAKFRQATGRNRTFFGVNPPRQQLPRMQQDFQEQLQRMIEESRRQTEEVQRMLDQSRRGGNDARLRADDDQQDAQQQRSETRQQRRERASQRGDGRGQTEKP